MIKQIPILSISDESADSVARIELGHEDVEAVLPIVFENHTDDLDLCKIAVVDDSETGVRFALVEYRGMKGNLLIWISKKSKVSGMDGLHLILSLLKINKNYINWLSDDVIVLSPGGAPMADDANKKGQDARTMSSQPHEIDYVVGELRAEYPKLSSETIRNAVLEAKRRIRPSEARDTMMAAARRILDG